MLKLFKRAVLVLGRMGGLDSLLASSRWRSDRILILCYHGISLQDEHLWDGELYMSSEMFTQRLELLKTHRCSVLPLDEALNRLDQGNLPSRSVVITFDDGMFDFYKQAMPVLKAFGFPATVYLTSYYARSNRPVFYLACSYLLWKCGATPQQRSRRLREIALWTENNSPSSEEQQKKLVQISTELGAPLSGIVDQRMLHLMNPAELRDASGQGFSIQLHTHRHRTPSEEQLFAREIEENRRLVYDWTGKVARHFCYPNGTVQPEFLPWLRSSGIDSATTCIPGLVFAEQERLLLPRLVDNTHLSETEFRSWLSGSGACLRMLRPLITGGPAQHE